MKDEKTCITVIIPAYNEEMGIQNVINGVKNTLKCINNTHEIIVVDDGSIDKTAEIVEKNDDVRLIQHPHNKGYGAALKTGVKNAKGDVVLFIDADAQHNPNDIKRLLESMDKYDMVVGARTKSSKISLLRKPGKFALSVLANYLVDQKIPDLNSGFRAIKKDIVMKYISILPDTFSFTTTITLAAIKGGYDVQYIPIETGAGIGDSKIKPFKDGFRFIMLIFRTIIFFDPLKVFFPISLLLIIPGTILALYGIINYDSIPKSSLLLIGLATQTFFFGLLADQISLVRGYNE